MPIQTKSSALFPLTLFLLCYFKMSFDITSIGIFLLYGEIKIIVKVKRALFSEDVQYMFVE